MRNLQLNQTAEPLEFFMADSTDHNTGKTGLSPTVTLSKNGGSFASPSGAVTEIGNGFYKVAGNATDENTLGPLLLHATGTGADPADVQFQIVAFSPRLNFSGTADAGSVGGLATLNANIAVPADTRNGALIATETQLTSVQGTVAGLPAAIWAVLTNTLSTAGSIGKKLADWALGTDNKSLLSTDAQTGVVIPRVTLVDTLTTYTGNTPQTGDSFARIGAAGAGLTALGDTRVANLDATISSRLAAGSYAAPDNTSIAAIKTQTDKLVFTVAGKLDANAILLNGVAFGSKVVGNFNVFWQNGGADTTKKVDDVGTGGGSGGVSGPGASQNVMNIENTTTGLPIADADVWISTDAGGANVVAGTLQTDSSGNATFLLDAGVTYYLWMQKDGVNPIKGQSFVAS